MDGFTNSFIIISSLSLLVGSSIGGVGGYKDDDVDEEEEVDDWLTSSLIVDEFDANESIIINEKICLKHTHDAN